MLQEYLNYLQENDINEGWLLSGECKKLRKSIKIARRDAEVARHDKNPERVKSLTLQAKRMQAQFQSKCAGVKNKARQVVRTVAI